MKEIDTDSNRVIGIEFKSDNKRMFIFGVFFPADSNIDSYAYEFNIVEGLYNYYCKYGCVLVAGDLNSSCISPLHTNVNKNEIFSGFVNRCNIGVLLFILTLLVKTLLSYQNALC